MINVSELIGDPDFAQPNGVKVTRSTVEVVNHQQVKTSKEIKLTGIITISDENTDEPLDEADMNKEKIHIFTYNRLKTVGVDKVDGKNYAADIVHFNGADYIVRFCLDDAQYGFCRSTAVKLEQDVM
jgi:hypothetical protein|nr:MAG TPA: hypothetical protein [Caudoviricetes sp.]